MRPPSMGLEAARSGLMVTQKALDIIGNNMANEKTKGHTRRRLDTVSLRLYDGANYGSAIALAGQGVRAVGVGQSKNSYLDYKFREKYSDVGYHDQKMAVMEQLRGIISDPEVNKTGIQEALKELSDTLNELTSTLASKATGATIVMNAFKEVVSTLNQYDSGVKNLVKQIKRGMAAVVKDFNATLQQISELNKEIYKEVFNSSDFDGVKYGPNELMDDRSLLLDELVRYGKVLVEDNGDGIINVMTNGHQAVGVDGANYWTDELSLDKEGTGTFWQSTGQMAGLGNGLLNGFQDTLKGSSSVAPGIPYYQGQLDLFAQSLCQTFNNVLKVENADPDATVTYKQLLKGGEDGIATAGDLGLSDKWLADASYTLNSDGGLGDIKAMCKLLRKEFSVGGLTRTFRQFIINTMSTLGNEMNACNTRLEAALAIAETAETNRQSVSGVSLNEEGVNMMPLNKTFQALGRLMTVMDEQLDVIINQMGLVGR